MPTRRRNTRNRVRHNASRRRLGQVGHPQWAQHFRIFNRNGMPGSPAWRQQQRWDVLHPRPVVTRISFASFVTVDWGELKAVSLHKGHWVES